MNIFYVRYLTLRGYKNTLRRTWLYGVDSGLCNSQTELLAFWSTFSEMLDVSLSFFQRFYSGNTAGTLWTIHAFWASCPGGELLLFVNGINLKTSVWRSGDIWGKEAVMYCAYAACWAWMCKGLYCIGDWWPCLWTPHAILSWTRTWHPRCYLSAVMIWGFLGCCPNKSGC